MNSLGAFWTHGLLRGLLCGFALAIGFVADAAPALVSTVEVEKRPWQQTVALYGTLTSPRDAQLTARVAGLVDSVTVDAGDRLAAGDVLIELDRRLDALTLDTLEASAAQARAELAEARRLRAESEQLASRNAVSSTEVDARRSQVAVRTATLQRLQAEVARQRERLDRHAVIAPFDGVVRERLVEPGEYVTQTTPVVALVATDTLRMDVAAPQQYHDRIRTGMPVRIQPDTADQAAIDAQVDVTVPASDPTARSFLVRIFVENPDGRLTPGMSAEVLFDIRSTEPVLTVPRDALVRLPRGGARVWIVETSDDGQARVAARQVSLGRGANGRVEVLDGLGAGAQVVVRGNENLSRDQPVRVRQDHGAHTSAADPPADGERAAE